MSFYTHTLSRQFLLLVLPTSLHRHRERAGRVEIHYHKHASIGMTYPPGYEHIYSLCVSLSPTNFSVGTSKLEKRAVFSGNVERIFIFCFIVFQAFSRSRHRRRFTVCNSTKHPQFIKASIQDFLLILQELAYSFFWSHFC